MCVYFGIIRTTKARHFEGEVGEGPETKATRRVEERPGDDEVRVNVRGPSKGEDGLGV